MGPLNDETYNDLPLDWLLRSGLSRRGFLHGAAALASVTGLSTLLAACGGDDDDDTDDETAPATATGETTGTTPTAAGDTASPTAGEASTPEASPPEASPEGTAQANTLPYEIEPPGHEGGQMIFGSNVEEESANPIISRNSNLAGVFSVAFEGLVQEDPTNGQPMPLLASSWEIAEDGLTYAFTLQEGVTWQDGAPFTANDAKFTYDLILNEETASPRYGSWDSAVTSIEVEDDTHLTIVLANPNATFLGTQGVQGIIPQHILQDVSPAEMAQHAFSTAEQGVTIGTGPFMFEEWVRGDHITFVKYPDYWESAPYLDTFILKVVPSQTVISQQLKTGEVDVAYIQPPDFEGMQQESNLAVNSFDSSRTVWYGYQLDPAKTTLFQEKEVRQALFYALDRPPIIEAVDFGLATVAVGTVAPISWAYNPDEITLQYPYDPDQAAQLLDQAGWVPGSGGIREKDGQTLAFTMYAFSGNDLLEQYITVMQQQWSEIGVEMTPVFEETNAVISRLSSSHDFETFLFNNSMGIDPDQSIYWNCSSYEEGFNFMMFCNEQVDELAQQGLEATDLDERTQIYTDLQNIMMDDLPVAFLTFQQRITATNTRVHNYFPNAVRTYVGAQYWWVDG